MSKVNPIRDWLRRRYLAASPKCVAFGLVHVLIGKAPATIELHTIRGGDVDREVEEISEVFEEAVKQHVSTCAKAQQYGLIAYAEDDKIIGQHTFRQRPAASSIDAGETEPPTPQGFLAMAMRHSEAYAKMLIEAQGGLMTNMSQQNDRLQKRVDELEQRSLDVMRLAEELLSNKSARDLDASKQSSEQARRDRLFIRAEQIVPALLERLSGAGPMHDLLDSIDDDQWKVLEAGLRPEQKEKLLNLVRQKAEIDQQRAEIDMRALPSKNGLSHDLKSS
jgi:hypothetical protein